MNFLKARNVSQALIKGLVMIHDNGNLQDSRVGQVLVMDGPTTILYERPKERVLFYPERNANPFFHFMEGLWMIAGRNDVAWISQFNSNMESFTDDGKVFHGAYGHRWRYHFEMDQLAIIADLLKANPDDRRCVLQMWDPVVDLGQNGKDFPCNTTIYFRVSMAGKLDMMVGNRSNDIIWGTFGANVVHMSMMQEYMAARIGIPVGRYWQTSMNMHLYTEHLEKYPQLLFVDYEEASDRYNSIDPYPMVNSSIEEWDQDLMMFMTEGPLVGFHDRFFKRVVSPIYQSWMAYKNRDDPDRFEKAKVLALNCSANDWRMACYEWLVRLENKS